jgi:hypothetical protein
VLIPVLVLNKPGKAVLCWCVPQSGHICVGICCNMYMVMSEFDELSIQASSRALQDAMADL